MPQNEVEGREKLNARFHVYLTLKQAREKTIKSIWQEHLILGIFLTHGTRLTVTSLSLLKQCTPCPQKGSHQTFGDNFLKP